MSAISEFVGSLSKAQRKARVRCLRRSGAAIEAQARSADDEPAVSMRLYGANIEHKIRTKRLPGRLQRQNGFYAPRKS